MPVLPDVASTTVCPGFSAPRASASRMIASASRSLTDAIGLNASTLTYMVTPFGARRLMRTIGVRPIVSRIESWIIAAPSVGTRRC